MSSHGLPLRINQGLLHHQLMNLILIDPRCLNDLNSFVHVRRVEG